MNKSVNSAVIVCSTARLARHLQKSMQHQHIQNGELKWQSHPIFTLSDWLKSVIENGLLTGMIDAEAAPISELTAMQESVLWEQSIAYTLKHHVAADLFDTSGLASAAMEANRLLIEWNISLDLQQTTEETQQFMRWRQRFQWLCKQAQCLESVRYQAWQLTCLQQHATQLGLPKQLQLAGFDRQHPHLKRLISILQASGVEVSQLALTFDAPQQIEHILLTDQEAECRAAVAWAQAQLQQNPSAKLAIVVPELEALRPTLAHLLDDTFHPHAIAPAQAETQRCYEFSLGAPLARIPIIDTALQLLRFAWQGNALEQFEMSGLLQNPYWSASFLEADARAKLVARMRQDLPLHISPQRLIHYVTKTIAGEHALPLQQLLADLQGLRHLAQQQVKPNLASQWASEFKQVLSASHWPGERALSSHEYQAIQAFDKVLAQLASLDALLANIRPSEAIKRLYQLCQAQIFQAETKSAISIQVMGMMEAAAEPLDGMWVTSMNDHIWPPMARPNALIPAELQRAVGAPNASSEVQTAFAQAVHQRLVRSAQQVIFSSAEKDGERTLRISPLMQGIEPLSRPLALAKTLAETIAYASTQDWQWLDDHQAPPVLAGEHISGGTALLKAQAICPAWAFYQYRLNARKLDDPVNGLDVMERGTLVHDVLATFWRTQTVDALMNMSEPALSELLMQISQEVLAKFNAQKDEVFSAAFLTLEAERLSKLVLAWLVEVEKMRPQGFIVKACEQENKLSIEGVTIKLILDRIDTLDDGRLLVMDYKTGRKNDYKNWAQASITEPQLPIYAAFVLEDAEVAAVCFAKVRTAEHGFIGIAADPDLVQGAQVFNEKKGRAVFDETLFPDWASIIQHWRTQITATAVALKTGDAAVRFEDEKQLAYCDVLPLLRLPERQLQFERKNKAISCNLDKGLAL